MDLFLWSSIVWVYSIFIQDYSSGHYYFIIIELFQDISNIYTVIKIKWLK